MRFIVRLSRIVLGAAVGMATIAMFLESRIDGWIPLLVGSVLAAAAVPAVSVAIGSRHYTAWISRHRSTWRSVQGYIAIETAIGWPVVAVASLAGFAFTFWMRVAP